MTGKLRSLASLAGAVLLAPALLAACGGGDAGLSRADVEEIVRPEMAAPNPRFVAAESLLLSGLVLLGVYVLWGVGLVLEAQWPPEVKRAVRPMILFLPWQPVLAVSLVLAAYWALQAFGRSSLAFALAVLAAALPHGVPAWFHNRIGWYELIAVRAGVGGERAIYWDMALFVACLVGLVTLHRIADMRRLDRRFSLRGLEPTDRRRVMRYEALMLIGLVVAGLLLAGLLVVVAEALAAYSEALGGSPLAIVALGGFAALLLALTLLFWFRGRQGTRD